MSKTIPVLFSLGLAASAFAADRKFGGCNDAGTLCAGPAASLSLVKWNLDKDTSDAGIIPGIGYGLTLWPREWYATGAALFFEYVKGDDAPDLLAPAFVLSFAEYVRVGFGLERTSAHDGAPADTDPVLLFGIGADFGAAP